MEEYFLKSKNDKSDRSAEIEEKLKNYGVCILGSGAFYVTGVKMPDHSTIMGQGNATRVILAEEVCDGAAIQIGSFCTVRNLCIRLSGGAKLHCRDCIDTEGNDCPIIEEGERERKPWSRINNK